MVGGELEAESGPLDGDEAFAVLAGVGGGEGAANVEVEVPHPGGGGGGEAGALDAGEAMEAEEGEGVGAGGDVGADEEDVQVVLAHSLGHGAEVVGGEDGEVVGPLATVVFVGMAGLLQGVEVDLELAAVEVFEGGDGGEGFGGGEVVEAEDAEADGAILGTGGGSDGRVGSLVGPGTVLGWRLGFVGGPVGLGR